MKVVTHHSITEDMLAMLTASLLVALGVYFFRYSGFLTGGVTGIALMLAKVTPFSFGQIFFVMNLPFYYLAWTRMGKRFTLNTLLSVTLVSVISDLLPQLIQLQRLQPIFAAVLGGFLVGMGILILFRHVSSLGGLGVLAKYCQDRFQWSAGRFQMVVDLIIVVVGFLMVSLDILLYSIIGAVAVNIVIAINHKPGRYQIT